MELTQSLIKEYAKKIYCFAYSKTRDTYNAEDLSQEIIVQLCDGKIAEKDIENMDAYIYRICFYTWSNYLRKNKHEWEASNNALEIDWLESNENIEESYITKEFKDKLRQEIMYLSKMRREITIMFYYENKSSDEISQILGIPSSTVRWHLRQMKTDLKERLEMDEYNAPYVPVKLEIGHSGWVKSNDMNGLCSDLLMQNICWICGKKALTIEDIARTLGVAAVYLEDKIEKLLYMDYLKKVGMNRYQTNFYILDRQFILAQYKFLFENTLPIALQFYNALKSCLYEIKSTGFIGCNTNDNFLLYTFLPLLVFRVIINAYKKVINEKGLQHICPKRKDGSEHWVLARLRDANG
ncbi:MAG TPA: sigma-70 family RNA polymerase sigma factor [Clostridiaceae bacterium]|nr:sigma-70 family RNA polymerase sigma factor [Clostridiaceae bacterium]